LILIYKMFPRVTAHALRHTAPLAVSAGVNVKVV
jgi:hypothetical protein